MRKWQNLPFKTFCIASEAFGLVNLLYFMERNTKQLFPVRTVLPMRIINVRSVDPRDLQTNPSSVDRVGMPHSSLRKSINTRGSDIRARQNRIWWSIWSPSSQVGFIS